MNLLKSDFTLSGDKNYWGTSEQWDEIERRKSGREGRKFREKRGKSSLGEIAQQVSDQFEIEIDMLKSNSQKTEIVAARREAMGRMYEEGYGPTEIGKFFNQTPSSVVHAYEKWIKT